MMWLVWGTAAYLVVVVPLAIVLGKSIKFGMGEKNDGAN
jgi:hypothetical protein